jgi:hypothetical protein
MQYALLIYSVEPTSPPPDADAKVEMDADAAFTQDIVTRGLYKGGEALQPTATATTVRVRDGQTITTDGPFVETKEALGGFYLVDAADLDAAIEIAANIPGAKYGSIEVRPVWEVPVEYQVQGEPAAAAR